jgi:hypothetical protein
MVSATIDHLVSLIVFLCAVLLFIGLFNQTIQTGIVYQHNRAVATKCSDLLDNMLLNSGIPNSWGQNDSAPTGFGLQDPEFTQYTLSPFSLMHLTPSTGTAFNYSKTGLTYGNLTMGFGQSLFVPANEAVNYSAALKLLGINGTYGFSLALNPIVTVSITEVQLSPTLNLTINVVGTGSALVNAKVNYAFMDVHVVNGYPTYTISYGNASTDNVGSASNVTFAGFDGTKDTWILIAYAHLQGLVGVGYHTHVLYSDNYVVPLVSSFQNGGNITLAHSYDVVGGNNPPILAYTATFVTLANDFTLRQRILANPTGQLGAGAGNPPALLLLNSTTPGILVVTYNNINDATQSGAVVMPWGIGSLGFPVTFGGNPVAQEWVATDLRQVKVGSVAYQVTLSLWSTQGYQVNG